MKTGGNPWLRIIPAEDYEGHMEAAGQSAVLRDLFSFVYGARQPIRLAVLGCTTGGDFCHVDPAVTEMVVGVDINRDYLELARERSFVRRCAKDLPNGKRLVHSLFEKAEGGKLDFR